VTVNVLREHVNSDWKNKRLLGLRGKLHGENAGGGGTRRAVIFMRPVSMTTVCRVIIIHYFSFPPDAVAMETGGARPG